MEIALILISLIAFAGVALSVVLIARQNRASATIASLEKEITLLRTHADEVQQASEQRLNEERKASEKRLLEEREASEQRLTETRMEGDRRVAEVKAEAEQRLVQVQAEAEKRLAEVKAESAHNTRTAMDAQKELFDKQLSELKASMQVATNELLKGTQQDFHENSSKRLEEILKPFNEKLGEMKTAVDGSKVSQAELRATMETQIKHLIEQTQLTARSADDLARALTHDPKFQGDWGENECEQLLQHLNMREGIEYDKQVNIKYKDLSGKERNFRPDFVLHLDAERDVIVDSKVSLTAFKDYCAAENEEARQEALKRHLESVEGHVKELAEKDYGAYLKVGKTMNFVIMYVPITGALWLAMREKPSLWRKAMDRQVYIADEQTLFAALSIIRMTWTKVAQLQHQEELYSLASEMVKRVGMFYAHFQAVGKSIGSLQKSYEEAQAKLDVKGQSIIVTANQIVKLGAKEHHAYSLPNWTDKSDESDRSDRSDMSTTADRSDEKTSQL